MGKGSTGGRGGGPPEAKEKVCGIQGAEAIMSEQAIQ